MISYIRLECYRYSTMSTKNGGPYTKEEQESRRLKVYEMHFQKSMPAVQIAKEIGCNRNTVNEDIKYWLSQIGSIFGKKNVYNATIEEMEILKNQRNELLEESNSYDVGDKLRAKKNAIQITSKIMDFYLKIFNSTPEETRYISHEEFVDVVSKICSSGKIDNPSSANLDEIKKAILEVSGQDIFYVNAFTEMLKNQGLTYYAILIYDTFINDMKYNLISFAKSKNIIITEQTAPFIAKKWDIDSNMQN